jgi:serine/threonine protein phosphatase 1
LAYVFKPGKLKRRIAIGDIHGCIKTLQKLIGSQIKAEKEDHIYLVGDMIDRGPKSCEVLDYIMNLKDSGYNIFPLRGNHEDMFIKAFSDVKNHLLWLRNGAKETLSSFNIPERMHNSFKAMDLIPDKYPHFLSGLPYYYDLKDYIIVHAGLNITSRDIFSDTDAMLWSRELKGMNFLGEHICVVHGHTPTPIVSLKHSLTRKGTRNLNIDGGCVYNELPGYGILAGLDLDSRKLYEQKNIDN